VSVSAVALALFFARGSVCLNRYSHKGYPHIFVLGYEPREFAISFAVLSSGD
jgi:hypothetical protein